MRALFSAFFTVGSLTGLSRITGFLRDLMIAAVLGAGGVADAFFVSFKLANFLRRLFAEGAFNAGFVPLFGRTLEIEGRDEAIRFGSQVFSVMLTILLLVVLLAELTMPWLVRGLAPGFEPGGERYQVAVALSYITFPYLLFVSLVALMSGVLNTFGYFAAPAFAPVLLNIVLIGAMALSFLHPETPAHALAWGVALAGMLQLAWVMVAARRAGIQIYWVRPRITPRIRRLFRLVVPGVFGSGVAQINLLVDTWFASTLATGAVSYLFYADRLNQLPLGMIGIAVGTALLPLLTRQLRSGAHAVAMDTQNRAIELALFFTLPAATALIAIGHPIIEVLFERGAFDAQATAATAAALRAFAIGLPAYVLIKVLAPAFFAREDTVTPVKIAALALLSNIVLIMALIGTLGHVGIALATALSNWLNGLLLYFMLRRRGHIVIDARLKQRLRGICFGCVIMAVVLWASLIVDIELSAWIELGLMIGIGGLGYLATAYLAGGFSVQEIRSLLRAKQA
ncbi:MAG: murein biosynthesis integral membrane protein MurJ [Pseudomonadota bacterium]